MLRHFREELIIPYASILRQFSPVAAQPGWLATARISKPADLMH
jgi:hypothetical protein